MRLCLSLLICVCLWSTGYSNPTESNSGGKLEDGDDVKKIFHHRRHSVDSVGHGQLREDEFDVGIASKEKKGVGKGRRSNKKKNNKLEEEREDSWQNCANGSPPVPVAASSGRGVMCSDLYPETTCCSEHDLTMELEGDKLLEQVDGAQCIRFLMKLRCAHCSPRSWWLFHASDKMRLPHRRALPIMCPGFCRKFHRACRDSVAGLEADDFCDYNTSNEEGPCFPDALPKRGTID